MSRKKYVLSEKTYDKSAENNELMLSSIDGEEKADTLRQCVKFHKNEIDLKFADVLSILYDNAEYYPVINIALVSVHNEEVELYYEDNVCSLRDVDISQLASADYDKHLLRILKKNLQKDWDSIFAQLTYTHEEYSVYTCIMSKNWNSNSFLFLAVYKFQEKIQESFERHLISNGWSHTGVIFDANEVVNTAADAFVEIMYLHTGERYPDFGLLTLLSSYVYEQRECNSNIGFLNNNRKGKIYIKFNNPIAFNKENTRYIRKLLEISTGELYLLVEKGTDIIGIGFKEDCYCTVKIKGHLRWRIYDSKGKMMLEFKHMTYKAPTADDFNVSRFNTLFNNFFRNTAGDSIDIVSIIVEALKQKHGTTVIIADEAEKETSRLCNAERGITIQPINLIENIEIIEKLTAIDGAMIIDSKGICYSIGVILDGNVVVAGNKGRGARYNSAYNYIAGKAKKETGNYLAVIISEDDTIDMISSKDQFTYI